MGDKPELPADRMLAVLGMTDLSAAEKVVLAAMSWYDGSGGCFPSMKSIGYDTGLSRVSVNKHIQSIKKKGRLSAEHGQNVNIYIIHYDGPTVNPGLTLKDDPEQADPDPSTVNPGLSPTVNPVFTRTGRTGIKEKQEEQETPVCQEKKVATERTQGSGTVMGYQEITLEDGSTYYDEVYES